MELGLLYYNARFYAPGLGRFLSADSIVPDPTNPQSLNRYSYTRNSPLNLIDPTGHRECDGSNDCSDPFNPQSLDPEPLYFRDHKGTNEKVTLGRDLTEDELLLVTLVVFVENSSGSYQTENMTLSAWVYFNQISTKPNASVFDAIDGASQTWTIDPSFVEHHKKTYGEIPNDPAGREEWVLNVARGYMSKTGHYADNFQALRRGIIEDIYSDWREYGTNSSADPTHGSVFAVNRDVSQSWQYAAMFAEHTRSNSGFSYIISHPNHNGSTVVVGNGQCAYAIPNTLSQSNCN